MPSYTVREIKDQRAWPSDGETKVIYYDVLIEGDEKIVNVGRKPTNLLNVGDVIVGDLQADRGGWKFRAEQKNGFGGGHRPRDPVEGARIMRQHAQEMGLRYTAIRGKPDFTLDDLRKIIDWFDADAKAAKP